MICYLLIYSKIYDLVEPDIHCMFHTNLRLIRILYWFNVVHIPTAILKDKF